MANILVIFVCLATGLAFQRFKSGAREMAAALSHVVIFVALPAVTLVQIHELGEVALLPALSPWLVLASGVAFFAAVGHALRWPRARVGALILCGAFGNTSFVGYPLIEAIYGAGGMPTAVLIDQAGTFTALATAGMVVLAVCSGRAVSARAIARRIFLFPPFIAFVAALALRPLPFSAVVLEALGKIGATLVPLALLSVGLQLKLDLALVKRHARALALGLSYKLALAPLLVVGFLALSGGLRAPLSARITVAQAAMAPMITGAVLASEYGLDHELANLLVGVGIPLSLLTVPVWAWLVSNFF